MKEKNTFEVVKIENNLFANIKPTIKTQEKRKQIIDNAWKKKIRKRDNYRCQCCGKKIRKKLEVHHIMPFAKYEGLAKNSGNVISLCHKCHQKYHDIYREKENSVTFAQYLRDYGRIVN